MSIKILKPGVLTTLQDQGRVGYQKYGVIVSGAMDTLASRMTNMLVGNEENAAVLEITLVGPNIEFHKDALIALGGGDMSPTINGKPVHTYRSVWIRRGSVLKFGNARQGCRVYLAVAGGFNVPLVMGSYSTYLRAEMGGCEGRPLKRNDELTFGFSSNQAQILLKEIQEEADDDVNFSERDWGISSKLLPRLSGHPVVRVFRGRQYHWFTRDSCQKFLSEPFEVTTQSDRMGYRLHGPRLELTESKDLLSEAVTFGTVQVPSDGNPIILLADRQTTGGYAKIAQVATVDLPILAQLKPGSKMDFSEISHDESQKLNIKKERELWKLQRNIDIKIRGRHSHVS